jgi:eukaryotic-like serine/threonine-protein kinase
VGCLDEGQIGDFLEGRMSPAEDLEARAHVSGCDACRELVAELARGMAPADDGEGGSPLTRGNTIGRYVILDVVGAGGMGVVYAAYDPELDRKIAVKLLRRDVSTAPTTSVGELGKRLLREAQAMAKLSHPNVVSVYDAGSTKDGQVFVAMEFIQGQSLGRWLKLAERTWRDVLEVYTKAGHGLAAAHAAGLVHRDFKPENVMVGNDGRVLVTDFGLARPLERGLDSAHLALARAGVGGKHADETLTEAGAIAGTPAYMSPEQLEGKPANVLTDQYSFCVSLYEGLYGHRPFDAQSFEELLRESRKGRVRDAPKDTLVPTRVRTALVRGLSPDPGARYLSMDELLFAVQPRRYQMRRRVIALLGVIGIVLAAILGSRWAQRAPVLCTGADEKLTGVWDAPRRAQIKAAFDKSGRAYAADAWRGTERTLDAYAHGWVATRTEACVATRVRGEQSEEMLDRRVECLDSHLRQFSALSKLFSEADGDVVARALAASLALPSLSDCSNTVALKAGVRPPSDPAKADRVQNAHIHLARVNALYEAGKYDEARLLVEPVIADARDVGYLPLEAETLALDGRISGRLDDTRRAERSLRQAAEAALASGHDAVAARAFIDLVYFIGDKEARYDDATQWSRYAEVAIQRLGGNDELEADRLESFSIISWRQGKNDESLAALDRAITIYKKVLGKDHPKIAHAMDGVASVYFDQGRIEDSYELDKQALELAERALGASHPQLSVYLNNMGNELLAVGRYDEALKDLTRALDLAEKTVGGDHPETVPPLDTMGTVLVSMGRADEAVPLLTRAKTTLERAGRKETPDYAAVLNDLGEAELARGRADLAMPHHLEALAVVDKVLGKDHQDYGMTIFHLAEAHFAIGKAKDALAEDLRALDVVDKAAGADSPAAARILLGIGRARMRLGPVAGAVEPLEHALRIREAHHGDPRELADARFTLAQALWQTGKDKDRARKLAKDARATYEGKVWLKERLTAVDTWLADIDGRVTRVP